jgi:hypothetical protein
MHVICVIVGANAQQQLHALLAPVLSGAVQWRPLMQFYRAFVSARA